MCERSTAYNTYATLSYTNPLFQGFSRYQNVNKEIIFRYILEQFYTIYYTSEFRFWGVFYVIYSIIIIYKRDYLIWGNACMTNVSTKSCRVIKVVST